LLVVVPKDEREWHWTAVTAEQITAAASPEQPTQEVLGNFDDLMALIEQLSEPLSLIELGNPVPQDKFMPRRRAGSCPAAHNDALVGECARPGVSRTSDVRRARR